MQINFKKIASVATSALMIGSTVALAAAANYPAPFSSAQSAVVYGSDGAATDLVAASDIRDSLRGMSSDDNGSDSATTSGEVYPLFTGSTQLYLNDSLTKVRTTITDSEMPMVLADGDFSGDVDADITQTIVLGNNPRITFDNQPDSSEDPQIGVAFSTSAANAIYNATVTFDRPVNFTHVDSQGESLDLFGREFTVGADTSTSELVLFQSSETIFLSQGGESPMPSRTVTVDGEEYTIELLSASDDDASIQVTDSSGHSQSREIDEDDSRQVNGVEIALKNADESEATGTVSAQITVGSQKIVFSDGDQVKVGTDEEPIDGTRVSFTGSTDDLTVLTVSVYANDSDADAILAGSAFTDPVFGSFKIDFTSLANDLDSSDRSTIEVVPAGDRAVNAKLTHQDTEKSVTFVRNDSVMRLAYGDQAREAIKVVERALLNESNYVVVGNEEDGRLVEVQQISNQSSGYSDDRVEFNDVFSGETYRTTITSEGAGTVSIAGKTYGVTYSGAQGAADEAKSVRLNYPDSSGNALILFPTIDTQNGAKVAFYEPVTVSLDNYDGAGSDVSSLLVSDGDDYHAGTAITYGTAGGNGFGVGGSAVNATGAGTAGVTFTAGQLTYNATWSSANTTTIYLVDPISGGNIVTPALVIFEEEEDDGNVENAIVVRTQGTSEGPGVQSVPVTGTAFRNLQLDSDDDVSQTVTKYGSLVTMDDNGDQPDSAVISYPDEQTQAMIYIAEESATIVGGSSSGSASMGSVLVRDSEASTVSTKNMIVVGGSCVNTVAAQLLALSGGDRCGSGFTATTGVANGEFLVQTFASPFSDGKVAMLVAGYNAQDTINAARYVTTQTVDTSVGKKYKGTSQTQATLVTDSE